MFIPIDIQSLLDFFDLGLKLIVDGQMLGTFTVVIEDKWKNVIIVLLKTYQNIERNFLKLVM